MYTFRKPTYWNKLALFQKIKFYGKILDKKYSKFVDKIEAKKIVKEIIKENDFECAKIIRILESPNDINQEDISSNCLIKASHGSGWNIDMANERNINKIKNKLNIWNKTYSFTEKQYIDIKPQFFIEEKINDNLIGITGKAIVWMIRCIRGIPISIGVKYNNIQNIYDTDFNLIGDNKLPIIINKPSNLERILEISRILSKDFEFVRMDFYLGNDKIYFSEYTFTPNNGMQTFPIEMEMELGKLWI